MAVVMKNVMLIGATSSLAYALAHVLAKQQCALVLAARDTVELEKLVADIAIRYQVPVFPCAIDFDRLELPETYFAKAEAALGASLDTVIMAAGEMGPTDMLAAKPKAISQCVQRNLTGPIQLLQAAAHYFIGKHQGTIAVISSVAGDRGRQSNYLYGSTKAGLSAFAAGLRNWLFQKNVHVLTIKPGFLDTPMTYGMESPLITSREKAAQLIIKAVLAKKDVVYVPWFWWGIMKIIQHIPEKLFKRLSL